MCKRSKYTHWTYCTALIRIFYNVCFVLYNAPQALQITRDYDLAMKCFQEVVKLDPSNRSSRQQILVCKNKMKEQRDKDKKMYTNIFQKLSKLSERLLVLLFDSPSLSSHLDPSYYAGSLMNMNRPLT